MQLQGLWPISSLEKMGTTASSLDEHLRTVLSCKTGGIRKPR
jgi:hypothetical protein